MKIDLSSSFFVLIQNGQVHKLFYPLIFHINNRRWRQLTSWIRERDIRTVWKNGKKPTRNSKTRFLEENQKSIWMKWFENIISSWKNSKNVKNDFWGIFWSKIHVFSDCSFWRWTQHRSKYCTKNEIFNFLEFSREENTFLDHFILVLFPFFSRNLVFEFRVGFLPFFHTVAYMN